MISVARSAGCRSESAVARLSCLRSRQSSRCSAMASAIQASPRAFSRPHARRAARPRSSPFARRVRSASAAAIASENVAAQAGRTAPCDAAAASAAVSGESSSGDTSQYQFVAVRPERNEEHLHGRILRQSGSTRVRVGPHSSGIVARRSRSPSAAVLRQLGARRTTTRARRVTVLLQLRVFAGAEDITKESAAAAVIRAASAPAKSR